MSGCASNTTDCLLTELVEQGEGFDWDPLNFAFTAILSVLALLIASLALLQGLLAAGPGRLKASKSSIGPVYGKTAKTRFDWKELRFRTTVQVPFIDIPQIIAQPQYEKDRVWLPREEPVLEKDWQRTAQNFWSWSKPGLLRAYISRSSARKSDVEAESLLHVPDNAEVLANWWMLLLDAGLEALRLRTRLCKTDHLPADVAAAPAFATIDSLMILALLTGCDSYDVDRRLPIAKGSHVQLIFRQHPNLGTVASYQSYKESSNLNHLPLNWARWGCLEALGHLHYHEESLLEAVGSWGHFLMQHNTDVQAVTLALLFADEPRANALFPLRLLHLHNYRQFIMRGRPDWQGDSLSIVKTLKRCINDEKSLLLLRAHGLDRLFRLDLKHSQFKDHHTNPNVSQTSSTTLLADNIAGTSRASWLGSAVPGEEGPLRDFPLHPDQFLRTEPRGRHQTLSAADGDLIISADVLDICFDWLDEDEFILNMPIREKAMARKWVSWQLAIVDSWLRVYGSDDALCAALNVLVKLHTSTRDALRARDVPRHPRLAILGEGLTSQPWAFDSTLYSNGNNPIVENVDAMQGRIARGDETNNGLYLEYRSSTNTIPGVVDLPPLQIEGDEHRSGEDQSTAIIDTDQGRDHRIRRPSDDEYAVIRSFYTHVRRCKECPPLSGLQRDPPPSLCDLGRQYAHNVATYLYPRHGLPFSVIDKEDYGTDVEVVFSAADGYGPVLELMAALERGVQLAPLRSRHEEAQGRRPEARSNPTLSRAGSRERKRPKNNESSRRERSQRRRSREQSGSRERRRAVTRSRVRSRTRTRPDDNRRHDEQPHTHETVVPPIVPNTWEPRDRVEALETLLVLRAVLYATLLSTAIDSSDILEMKNQDEIVRVL